MSLLTSRIWALKQTVHAIVHQRMLFMLALSLASLAMTIPFFFFSLNFSLSGNIFDVPTQTEITLFTERSAGSKTVQQLAETIGQNSIIADVRVMQKAQALELVNASLGLKTDRSAGNPLPDIIIATVAPNVSSAELAEAVEQFRAIKGIDSVAYDDQWAIYLGSLNNATTIALSLLGCIVGMLVLLVIFASVKLTTFAQRDEIRALHLFGATPSFIIRPYLWRGALTLTLSALASIGLTSLALNLLSKPVADFASLYHVTVFLQLPSYDWCILYVCIAALLGWVVSYFAATDAVMRVKDPRD